jgi:hypothetical protein
MHGDPYGYRIIRNLWGCPLYNPLPRGESNVASWEILELNGGFVCWVFRPNSIFNGGFFKQATFDDDR